MTDYFYSLEESVWNYYTKTYFMPDDVWDALIELRDEENQ